MCIFKGLDILRFWWGFIYSVVLKGPVFVVRIFYLSHFLIVKNLFWLFFLLLQLFTVNQVADDSCPNIVTLSEKKKCKVFCKIVVHKPVGNYKTATLIFYYVS